MSSPTGPNPLGESVAEPPTDGISRVVFSRTSDLLLASSWDKCLHLYDGASRQARGHYPHQAPLLDCCFESDQVAFSAGVDGNIRRVDLERRAEAPLGAHSAGVQSIAVIHSRGLVVSGGWDSTLRLWDPRAPPFQNCVASVPLPGKVYTMSCGEERLVVGTSGRHVLVFDVRRLEAGQPEQHRESSLKFQTRSIACFVDGRGYALGSVEGRVAMEFFDTSPEGQANKYAFKCHRRTEGGKDVVYPVHAIAFHQGYGTFATGGGDGVINIWDGDNKKRLSQTARYPTCVASLCFNRTGELLAVASSYTCVQGEREHPADAIFVRPMADAEVRPKQRKPPA